MSPIRPYTRYSTIITKMPLITERLFGVFTRGTRKFKHLASTIFTESILTQPDFSDEIPNILDEDLVWVHPAYNLIKDSSKYTWFLSVWYRINVASALLQYDRVATQKKNFHQAQKTEIFQNAHFQMAQYLDSFEDPSDENINVNRLISLYKSPGISYFDDDRNYIELKKEKYKVCKTPLEIIEEKYPQAQWRLENIEIKNVDLEYTPFNNISSSSHQIYLKCLTIMSQCKEYYLKDKLDVLYFYFAAFTDLIYYCSSQDVPRIDDEFLNSFITNTNVTVLQFYYPHDNRTFTCWDLPDLYSVLIRIPLHGVQQQADTIIQNYIQKSLPFCCQRRTLVGGFVKSLTHENGLTSVILKLFWCMFANMYPDTVKTFDMRRLIRAKQISSSVEILQNAFTRPFAKPKDDNPKLLKEFEIENNQGCFIIITAFQAWMYAITYNNPQYGKQVKQFLDWDSFTARTIGILNFLQTVDIFKIDVFAQARNLIKNVPIYKEISVYRYKKDYEVNYILKYVRKALEKNVFCELNSWKEDKKTLQSPNFTIQNLEKTILYENFVDQETAIRYCDKKINDLSTKIPNDIKQNILTILLSIPLADRMKVDAISVLTLEKYGNLSNDAIIIFLGMIDVYKTTTMPRFIEEYVSFTECVYDLKIICWYLTVVCTLNSIKVLPLDATTVLEIDYAMQHRKYKGQDLTENMYDVFVTICCQNINTLFGEKGFGHKDMCFDLETKRFMCAKTNKYKYTGADDIYNTEFEKEMLSRKQMRNCRKDFAVISCKNSPVLKIPLRGLQLVYNNVRYMHCPRCAGFHECKWTNWSGGRYRCEDCKKKEAIQVLHYKCSHCQVSLTEETARKHTLLVKSIDELNKRVYYCRKHFKIAKKYTWVVFEEDLKKKIKQKEEKNNISRIY